MWPSATSGGVFCLQPVKYTEHLKLRYRLKLQCRLAGGEQLWACSALHQLQWWPSSRHGCILPGSCHKMEDVSTYPNLISFNQYLRRNCGSVDFYKNKALSGVELRQNPAPPLRHISALRRVTRTWDGFLSSLLSSCCSHWAHICGFTSYYQNTARLWPPSDMTTTRNST